MSSHTRHPDVHTHGLQDGCPRCEEHAEHPERSLDNEMLEMLHNRLRRAEPARSDTEARAMTALLVDGYPTVER